MVYHGATLLETRTFFEWAIITEVRKMSQKLSDTILEFTGSDARTVLQGQTTRNFVAAETGSVLEGAFCDLKGRVIADFCAAIVRDDHILLRTDTEVANYLQSHLQKYLMFSKTRMTASKLSVWACRETADSDSNSVSESKVTVIRNGEFTEVWCQEDPRPNEAINANNYHANRLTHGEARVRSATIGKYLPQDLNFDLNGLIDFDKGCYTGQEIIARLHYRGQPKRRLRLLNLASQNDVVAGDKILNVEGKSIGTVVECVAHGDECLCLCETVIDIDTHKASIQDHAATPSALQRF